MSNVEVVRRAYEAFIKRDLDAVLALLDPEVEWGQPETLPWGGIYRGPAAVLEFFAKVGEHIDGLRVDANEYLDAGPSVVVLGWVRGTARRTGKPFAVRLAHAWKIEHGKVIWFYNYVDTAALLAALAEGPDQSTTAPE